MIAGASWIKPQNTPAVKLRADQSTWAQRTELALYAPLLKIQTGKNCQGSKKKVINKR